MSIECQKINGTTEYETPQFWNKKKLYKAGRPVPPEVSHQKREENYSVSLSLTPLISVPPVPAPFRIRLRSHRNNVRPCGYLNNETPPPSIIAYNGTLLITRPRTAPKSINRYGSLRVGRTGAAPVK